MTAPALSYDTFVQKVMPRIPVRRWGEKEDFAGIAAYLTSSASAYHTGDIIRIDGGFHSF
jgi:NAD(P)-dependent dehydrogenase (short-subunit alcohol dehydrogenase family)